MNGRIDLLRALIRDVPDFPKPGILFRDITPVLGDGAAFTAAIDAMEALVRPLKPDVLLPIESRGFLFAAPLANRLGIGLAPVRKPGKLPSSTHRAEYALEYGSGVLELHVDALKRGQRVVVIDDLIATGGTAKAAAELAARSGADIVGAAFFIELSFLNGRATLGDIPCHAVLNY